MEETIVFGTPLGTNLGLTTPTPQKPDTKALQVQRDLLEGEIAVLQNQKNMLDSSLDQRIGLGKFLLPENLYTTNNPLNPNQPVTTSDLDSLIAKKNEELQNVVNQITKINADFFQVTAPPVKDFTTEIASLQEETKSQIDQDIDSELKAEADAKAKAEADAKAKAEADAKAKAEAEAKAKAEAEAADKKRTSDINPLFDNPNFGMFLRNIGKSLVETGQMGTGLAVGAARAAEERAVVEKQREVAFQELLKEQVKAGAKKVLDPKFKDQVDQKYITNTKKIEENKASLDFLNQIENILLTDNPTGIPGLARQIGYNFRALLDPNAELDPKTRVENLLREIAVGDAETVLGQSSGRLSDKDIQLARQLVSEIEGISGAFTSESAITSVLARRRADIERDQATAASELMQSNILYNEYGLQPPPTAIFDYLSTSPSAANTDIAGEANLGD